ncbi:hypothetical protein [Photorhabdus bodei]|uniref:SIR2-like domain-containing protein n=1 Tax=Photorhabdus bodei TaxID=2029681 RepID=A0ABX0AQA0_9GAMM|nr:hypothetical protein [Photorhabdus bodei]NDL01019.1 hypothetical protein [Photorhabdus bodei]NDL05245.1 hypothetical protein [Photorhabdus bodei]NDL09524.1 hypothetical protein [Photorhabdus bodei]
MIFSDYFNLDNNQLSLDFVDIPLDTDLCLFIDPTAIRGLKSEWGQDLIECLQDYFSKILEKIKEGDDETAFYLLSSLRESNSFHLGYSKGKSGGKALGDKSADEILISLKSSNAAKSGLLKDLEDTALTIDGVASDRISDSVCNILKLFFIEYTQHISKFYGVKLEESEKIKVWDDEKNKWISKKFLLPRGVDGSVILIPKILARYGIAYSHKTFYNRYIMPSLRNEHLSLNSALVETLKSGKRRVTRKRLLDEYGASKPFIESQIAKFTSSLNEYREEMTLNPPPPLKHRDFQEINKIEPFKLSELTKELLSYVKGVDGNKYFSSLKKILPFIFYPSLIYPIVLGSNNEIFRLSYLNESRQGFFFELSVFGIESERVIFYFYNDISNDNVIDTMIKDLDINKVQLGIIFCRGADGKVNKRLKDLSVLEKNYILIIDDNGFDNLVDEYLKGGDQSFESIRSIFRDITS